MKNYILKNCLLYTVVGIIVFILKYYIFQNRNIQEILISIVVINAILLVWDLLNYKRKRKT
ncbi:putative membrane-anchored protein [Dysgonomonas sp. PFB1-18]|nr:putative membrane-anchored protein [Dysgonomonas sp. PF1-14]MDH6339435.1 putative membrane-anchored protein [Dysgonomonas sp. PF1-16]MDH6380934.1 putative membrane-anchored protein [Dysgonomonas sp. PFB1-18]MDH6397943.1 putative membrane-anchored protein [Dysgonomonas sp. PF1-23]